VVQSYMYFFQILFPYRLLQNTEYSSLYYIVGPCCLSVLYISSVFLLIQTPLLSLHHAFPFGNRKFICFLCLKVYFRFVKSVDLFCFGLLLT